MNPDSPNTSRSPSRAALLGAAAMVGVLLGVGAFTMRYAEGLSYFSTDPAACANCHIMWPQYASWQKASHHTVAGCVDCHLPTTFVAKYLSKAENGYYHSKGFTFQDFHEPILIKEKNARILQDNCLRCHGDVTEQMVHGATKSPDSVQCVHCHVKVGHGERAGLGGPADPDEVERILQ